MSFILDALKKLEREKESAEPGVVMVGPVTWGGRDRRRRGKALAAGAAALVLAVAAVWWGLGRRSPSLPSPEPGPNQAPARVALPASPSPEAPGGPVLTPGADTTGPSAAHAAHAADPGAPGPASGSGTATPALPPRTSLDDTPQTEPETLPLEDPDLVVADEVPLEAAGPPPPEFRLTAISSREGQPIALLNDRLVREGDRIGDVLIVKIGTTDIEIEVDGERQTIGF